MKPVSELLGDKSDIAVVAAAAVTVSLGLSLLLHNNNKKTADTRKLPPMPRSTLPFLKNVIDAGGNSERFHDWINDQCNEFNNRPWKFHIPGRPAMVVLSSPELFEDVLKTQEDIFLRGPLGQYISKDVFGNGLVISDGAAWYYHRRTARHLFSMKMMTDVMASTVEEKLAVFLDVLDTYEARGKPFGIKRVLNYFTMDSFAKIGFGLDLNTLKNSLDQEVEHKFMDAFDKMSAAFGVRIQSPLWLWELKRYLNIGWEKILMDNTKIMHNFITDVIVQSMDKKMELAAQGKTLEAKDLITLFMDSDLRETKDLHIEDDDATIMRDMVVTFLFAGKDSTAHSMNWFIVNINRHPDVLQKIREEMLEKVPGLLTGEVKIPTQEQIRDLVYLDAVVRENIRLHPSSGFVVREAMENTTLCDGTFIEKGQIAMISSYSIARNKSVWGPDALEFKPERMIDPETGKLRVLSPFVFSGFGAGQHNCIGKNFALMEIKLAMGTLLSKFDIKTVEDPWKLTYEFSVSIPVKGPVDVTVTRLAPIAAASS